eukprot:jgi/Tetstr1/454031/TSEL_040950.t1
MIIPVRCVTCGKVLADKWRAYQVKTGAREEEAPKGKKSAAASPARDTAASRKQAMDDLGLVRAPAAADPARLLLCGDSVSRKQGVEQIKKGSRGRLRSEDKTGRAPSAPGPPSVVRRAGRSVF